MDRGGSLPTYMRTTHVTRSHLARSCCFTTDTDARAARALACSDAARHGFTPNADSWGWSTPIYNTALSPPRSFRPWAPPQQVIASAATSSARRHAIEDPDWPLRPQRPVCDQGDPVRWAADQLTSRSCYPEDSSAQPRL